MADREEVNQRQRKIATSGALARVLQEVQDKGIPVAQVASAGLGPERAEPAARPRFFPTKGYARVAATACRPWRLADRPSGEFSHLDDLVASLQQDGQYQPVVVRPIIDRANPEIHYEVIAGQVRWRASIVAGVDLDISIRELDDAAAFRVMVGENDFRQGLSDYAKAQRLCQALKEGLYADRTTLAVACRLTPSQLSYFLGFAELDQDVVDKFSDIKKISARLGYAINGVVKQGFKTEVLRDLSQIESGQIRRESMPAIWHADSLPEQNQEGPAISAQIVRSRISAPQRFVDSHGALLFSVKPGGSGTSLRFGKDIQMILDESLWREIQALIEQRVKGSTLSGIQR